MAHLKDFQGIEYTDFFEQDRGLQRLLGDLLPEGERDAIFASLHDCASLVAGRWNDLAREANRNENLPKITTTDRVGNPVERVDFGIQAETLRREVAEFGLFTKARNNLHKFAMIYYTAHNGEASLNCGVSCTDGLIHAVEAKGSEFLHNVYLPKMLSSETPFAGAQFVTERTGGSDVGAIEMQAKPNADGTWTLTGEKWFCSNPDEYFLVAAKYDNNAKGTAGVAVFFVPRVLPDGSVNHLSFQKLKDKLGTRSLPTAEIKFEGAIGYAIGEPHEGFKTLMNYIINVSRIHNSISACAFLHRAFLEARNYAKQRESFGQRLVDSPLIQETLVKLLARSWRNRLLTFRLIAMVDENGLLPANEDKAMWQRFLTNLAKYRTALTVVDSVREAMLVLGGNGIVEDFTVLPRLFRDAMIIETWEGPPNTLCLQIVRDAARSNLLPMFQSEISGAVERWEKDFLSHTRQRFEQQFASLNKALAEHSTDKGWFEANARRIVDAMGGLLEVAQLVEMAMRHRERDAITAIMASLSARELFDNADFNHPAIEMLNQYSADLIDEKAIPTVDFHLL